MKREWRIKRNEDWEKKKKIEKEVSIEGKDGKIEDKDNWGMVIRKEKW